MKRVLITGAYGLIAGALYQHMVRSGKYEVHGTARRRHPSVRAAKHRDLAIPENRLHMVDLTDLEGMRAAVRGFDVVVAMAAEPSQDAPWDKILASNIVGSYNTLEAARLEGVPRVVYASSVRVNHGYKETEPYKSIVEGRFADVPDPIPLVHVTDPPRPTEPYSASKVWGEALARVYAEQHGMSVLCVRVGWVIAEDWPFEPSLVSMWSSQRDICRITQMSVDAPESLRFEIVYGLSAGRYCWIDLEHSREVLGYVPIDNAEEAVGRGRKAGGRR
jgi:nucleoside-diphosphate-sugar epimerase